MSIRDFNILSSKNDTFNLENTFNPGKLTKQASDRVMFNVNKLLSIVIEDGNPNNNSIIAYNESIRDWTYIPNYGPTGFIYGTGPTGPDSILLLDNVAYVATDTVNTNAQYTTVSNAVNGLGTLATTYFLKIISDTTDTSLIPSWKLSTDYHIKINKGATWYLQLSLEAVGPSNGNLTISGPGTLNISVLSDSIIEIFNLTSNYTLTFKNLNIVIENSINPFSYRTILNSSSNLVMENCNTNISDKIRFRYYFSGTIGDTVFNQSKFFFTGPNYILFDNSSASTSGILDINNCEYNGYCTSNNFIDFGTSTCSITNTLTYFDSGNNILNTVFGYGSCLINNLRDFGTISEYISLYSQGNQCINNVYSYIMDISDSTGTHLSNIYSSETLYVSSNNNVLTNFCTPYLDLGGRKLNCLNGSVLTVSQYITCSDFLLKNFSVNSFIIKGNDILTCNTVANTVSLTGYVSDAYMSNFSSLEILGGTQVDKPKFSTCKLYSAVNWSCSNAIVSNSIFSSSVIIDATGPAIFGGNRFENNVTFSGIIGLTGPLFTGNLGIPLTGSSGSIPSSIANSYIL